MNERPIEEQSRAMISVRDVKKRFGPVIALDGTTLDIWPGEIHGLVGENGAGKSTLMRIIAGIDLPDSGEIHETHTRPLERAIVPQYPQMAGSLPLWQNLLVGFEHTNGLVISRKRSLAKLASTAERFRIDIDLRKRTGDLNGTELRLAALLAALVREPDLLILDEPTVGLAIPDQQAIIASLHALRDDGIAVLFISHDLAEIAENSDRVTILRNGKSVATISREITVDRLVDKMLGGTLPDIPPKTKTVESGAKEAAPGSDDSDLGIIGIRFEDLFLYHRSSDRKAGPLQLNAERGRITVITGVRESGIDLIEGYFAGEARAVSGAVYVENHRLSSYIDPGDLRAYGLTYIPSDRFDTAAALDGSVEENAIVQSRDELHPRGIRRARSAEGFAAALLSRFGVTVQNTIPLGTLSGGTIQKLILARELERPADGCVISEPFSGLDVVSQNALIGMLRSIAGKGTAVVALTSAVDSALALGDDIFVLRNGMIHGPYHSGEVERINRAFAGILPGESK